MSLIVNLMSPVLVLVTEIGLQKENLDLDKMSDLPKSQSLCRLVILTIQSYTELPPKDPVQ